jgi:hypothetical protein
VGSYLEKPFTKIRLMEWLKVKALNSSPSIAKKKKSRSLFLTLLEARSPISRCWHLEWGFLAP